MKATYYQTPSQWYNSVNYTILSCRYMLITGTEYRCDSGVWHIISTLLCLVCACWKSNYFSCLMVSHLTSLELLNHLDVHSLCHICLIIWSIKLNDLNDKNCFKADECKKKYDNHLSQIIFDINLQILELHCPRPHCWKFILWCIWIMK